jgi:hypothetical protein
MVDGSSQAYRSRPRVAEPVGLFVAVPPGPAGPAVVHSFRPHPRDDPRGRRPSEAGREVVGTNVPALTAPALVVLASLCLLQGYAWLGFIPDSRRHSSAVWFAGIALASVVFLSHPERGRRRRLAQRLAVATAVAVALVTVPAVYGHQRVVGDALGALDLLLAASALSAALIGSRVKSGHS